GLESALAQAKAVAGDKDVGVGAASIVQQCIRAGLLDEIHIDLVPVLLGGGVSLFDHLGAGPIDLERTRVIEGAGVTHLTFGVIKGRTSDLVSRRETRSHLTTGALRVADWGLRPGAYGVGNVAADGG